MAEQYRVCPECGEAFESGRREKRFCTRKCYAAHYHRTNYVATTTRTKTCVWCGNCFAASSWNSKYCSTDCNRTAQSNRNKKTYSASAARARSVKSKYGISIDQFIGMLHAQGGGCAICGSLSTGNGLDWSVDHDHACCPGTKSCGKCVRGLLCNMCNLTLGCAKDNPEVLRAAAAYLESPTSIPPAAVSCRSCAECGDDFALDRADRKYCSLDCLKNAQVQAQRVRGKRAYQRKHERRCRLVECAICGKEFSAVSPNDKYCPGGACYRAAKIEQQREHRRRNKTNEATQEQPISA